MRLAFIETRSSSFVSRETFVVLSFILCWRDCAFTFFTRTCVEYGIGKHASVVKSLRLFHVKHLLFLCYAVIGGANIRALFLLRGAEMDTFERLRQNV